MTAPAAAPGPIQQAWQILASAAYILDTDQPSMPDLLAMTVLGDAMDALLLGRQPATSIAISDHAPHPPHQAARCALAILDTYRTDHLPDQLRVARSTRLLRRLVDAEEQSDQP